MQNLKCLELTGGRNS